MVGTDRILFFRQIRRKFRCVQGIPLVSQEFAQRGTSAQGGLIETPSGGQHDCRPIQHFNAADRGTAVVQTGQVLACRVRDKDKKKDRDGRVQKKQPFSATDRICVHTENLALITMENPCMAMCASRSHASHGTRNVDGVSRVSHLPRRKPIRGSSVERRPGGPGGPSAQGAGTTAASGTPFRRG